MDTDTLLRAAESIENEANGVGFDVDEADALFYDEEWPEDYRARFRAAPYAMGQRRHVAADLLRECVRRGRVRWALR